MPDGDAVGGSEIMDLLRLDEPADPSGLDVDHRGGSQHDRVSGRLGGDDRLVEAHRGVHELGELGVLADVGFAEGLFDEQETVVVEATQVCGIDEGVGGVRVDLEAEIVAEGLAHRGHRGDVLAGFDLQLDPGVALFEVAADDLDGLLDGILDADGHS